MNINPITPISPVDNIIRQTSVKAAADDGVFKNMLSELIDNVNETDRISKEDILKIASGDADDLHNLMINTEKAELATLTLVQVRNKILDAYNEIMRVAL